MAKTIKVLGIHGLGDHRNTTWESDWETAFRAAFPGQDQINLQFAFVNYDSIFEQTKISPWETMQAIWKLTRSAVDTTLQRRRGVLSRVSDRIKWTAGYVVAWVEDEAFQKATRNLLLDTIAGEKPDIIMAHSLGSLVAYNAFSHRDADRASIAAILKKTQLITLGSQIGNPFVVRNLTPGRIEPLAIKRWYHLFNAEDDVFTAPIRIWDTDNFEQVDAFFDIDGFADHSAVEYIGHRNVIDTVWRSIAEQSINSRSFAPRPRPGRKRAKASGRIERRALLIGIDEYPNPADRLEGCVNDVFLISSVLQECGFPPESIRVCLNDRATSEGILDRLEWLVDDPRPDDERVLFYSGHGATIPQYGDGNEPDRLTETLVPWNFDWSPETAITDDRIYDLYSQLPYETRLALIFDCCHSGGIHREGGGKVRGLAPPDDIRHRSIKWDSDAQMWVSRDFNELNPQFSSDGNATEKFFGPAGSTTRLGRASLIRGLSETEYRSLKRSHGDTRFGPYLPLIIEACAEEEFSYEYRHGVTSYGAFTYALASRLRRYERITFERLVSETREQLADLKYQQTPQILGPSELLTSLVPWLRDRAETGG